jgi:hypothetical protein
VCRCVLKINPCFRMKADAHYRPTILRTSAMT